jgi:hypothetical protein
VILNDVDDVGGVDGVDGIKRWLVELASDHLLCMSLSLELFQRGCASIAQGQFDCLVRSRINYCKDYVHIHQCHIPYNWPLVV